MKRGLSILLTLCLLLSSAGCQPAADEVVSGSGAVEFQSSSSQPSQPPPPESPPAVSEAAGSPAAPSSSAPDSSAPASQTSDGGPAPVAKRPSGEVRSVWVSYLELLGLMTGQSAEGYRENMAKVMQDCADFGLNTVILQVRPFGDAIYPSKYFPQSYLFTGEEGAVGSAPYDALQIAIEEARKRGLRIEAWLNPYRVRRDGDRPLSSDNPAHVMLQSGDAVKMGEVITYNPASPAAQQLIVNGVTELVTGYDIDAIHFDDYFYPTTDPAFDAQWYSDYQTGGGKLSLAAWRRSNVTALVRQVHEAIRAAGSTALFGISPQGNMENNFNTQYVDIEEIVKAGLIDYLCPQMYFGFQNGGCPYQSTIEAFDSMTAGTEVQLYVGLATYKFNKVDTWAGNGKNEWIGTTDLLGRQVAAARTLEQYGGFVLYRYSSSFVGGGFYANDGTAQRQLTAEMGNLKKLLG